LVPIFRRQDNIQENSRRLDLYRLSWFPSAGLIDAVQSGPVFDHQFVEGMLQSVTQLKEDLEEESKRTAAMPDAHYPIGTHPILFGEQKYTEIHGVNVLPIALWNSA